MQNIVNVLNANSNSPQNLGQIEPHFIAIMKQFPYPRVRKIFRSETGEIAEEFRQMILTIESEASSKIQAINERLAESETELNQKTDELKSLSREILSIQAQIDSKLEVWENQNKAEISEQLRTLSAEFEEAQSKRREESDKQSERITEQLDSARRIALEAESFAKAQMTEVRTSLVNWRAEAKKESEDTLSKIRNIYEIVGQTALAGDFEKAAKEETSLGTLFSWLASVSFIVAPIYIAYQWHGVDLSNPSLVALAAKLTGSVVFLIPAAYFGSTARRHRRVATALRSLGVRVATFDAYLANFSDEQRNNIKAEMASMFFAANISPDSIRSSSKSEIEGTIAAFTNAVSKIENVLKKSTSGGSAS